MQDHPEFVNNDTTINENNVLVKLVTAPKHAFAFIHTHKYQKYLVVIAMLSGMLNAFEKERSQNMGDDFPLWGMILMNVIIGALFGYISRYFFAYFIKWTGSWLEGIGSAEDLMRVVVYGSIPSLFGFVLLIIKIAVFGSVFFTSHNTLIDKTTSYKYIYLGSSYIDFGLTIWCTVLLTIGIAQVQQFSYRKAFLNLILPFLVMIILAVLLWVAIDLF